MRSLNILKFRYVLVFPAGITVGVVLQSCMFQRQRLAVERYGRDIRSWTNLACETVSVLPRPRRTEPVPGRRSSPFWSLPSPWLKAAIASWLCRWPLIIWNSLFFQLLLLLLFLISPLPFCFTISPWTVCSVPFGSYVQGESRDRERQGSSTSKWSAPSRRTSSSVWGT